MLNLDARIIIFTYDTKAMKPFSGIYAVLLVVLILVLGINIMPPELAGALVQEHGPVEMITAVGYLVAVGWLILTALVKSERWLFSASFMVSLLGFREIDFHSRFTSMGILKTRYYISPEVPGTEKAIVSVLMLIILCIAVHFVWTRWHSFLTALKAGDTAAVNLAMAIGFGFISKILDSMSTPLRKVVALFHNDPRTSLRVVEESMELAIPLFILLAIYHSFWKRE